MLCIYVFVCNATIGILGRLSGNIVHCKYGLEIESNDWVIIASTLDGNVCIINAAIIIIIIIIIRWYAI